MYPLHGDRYLITYLTNLPAINYHGQTNITDFELYVIHNNTDFH